MSMPELAPRNFSFNSPHGACPECTGLGTRLEIVPELVIPNPKLTLAEGAIRPWSKTTSRISWYTRMLSAVAEAYGFSMDVPVSKLPQKAIEVLMHGTGDKK
jgi:excinuclease ABC subunit A